MLSIGFINIEPYPFLHVLIWNRPYFSGVDVWAIYTMTIPIMAINNFTPKAIYPPQFSIKLKNENLTPINDRKIDIIPNKNRMKPARVSKSDLLIFNISLSWFL